MKITYVLWQQEQAFHRVTYELDYLYLHKIYRSAWQIPAGMDIRDYLAQQLRTTYDCELIREVGNAKTYANARFADDILARQEKQLNHRKRLTTMHRERRKALAEDKSNTS